MSTNSSIAVKIGDKIKSIYCHSDGYPSYNGRILLENYNSQEKAESVVSLGDLSILDKSMEAPEGHTFNTRCDGYSVAYGRDRGETGVDAKISSNYRDVNEQQYNYYWDGEKWNCNGQELTFDMIKD